MSLRRVPERSFGLLWALNLDDAAKVNVLLAGAKLPPFRNRFYGFHVRGVAVGIWLSTREKKGTDR